MEFDLAPLVQQLYGFVLAFARVGSIVMLMPGVGESFAPSRARLGLAFFLSMPIALSATSVPAATGFVGGVFAVMAETTTGLVFGGAMRFFLAAPVIAGQITGQLTALSNIFTGAGMPMETNSVLGAWMLMGAIAFVFVSGLHYLMIDAIAASYALVPAGEFPHMGDAAREAARTFGGVFMLSVQMATPFILLSVVFNLGAGLINKMLIQMPVFFVLMPVSILGGFFILAHAIGPILIAYRGVFAAWLNAPFQ